MQNIAYFWPVEGLACNFEMTSVEPFARTLTASDNYYNMSVDNDQEVTSKSHRTVSESSRDTIFSDIPAYPSLCWSDSANLDGKFWLEFLQSFEPQKIIYSDHLF